MTGVQTCALPISECEEPIANQDEVWVEPVTGVASWEDGWPYHMECAPDEPDEDVL